MVLRHPPSLSIGMECLACLNKSCGMQLGTLVKHTVGPRFEPRALSLCARYLHFFLHPPFHALWGDSLFCTFPTTVGD